MKELAKQYDPSQVEDRIYQFWLDGGYFHTKADPDKKPYTIVMPPPNVTGQLHMGHAVDNTMQDILIRTKRMQGYAALWVPGTDHASIATEAKVVCTRSCCCVISRMLQKEEKAVTPHRADTSRLFTHIEAMMPMMPSAKNAQRLFVPQ